MHIGYFACASNNLGIGKVTSISDTQVELEYFESIACQRKLNFSRSEIKTVHLSPQTRCYVKNGETWQVGRVQQTRNGEVEVDFPERKSKYIPIEEVYVRNVDPIINPTDVLANWGHEAAFFYERRKMILEGLVAQRNVSHGMNGLLSSSIRLLPHQVNAAKRILEDPVPRYLLSDEVGLGKTIEAGIVIRQIMLDHDNARILVISPSALKAQWQNELSIKFHIDSLNSKLEFVSIDEISSFDASKVYDLIVIDEAHHIAQWYFSNQSQESYYICQALAHRSNGLLLLSATPALHNEQAFLCMLNLLDPEHFNLEKIDDFVQLINKREEIAQILFLLKEDEDDIIIQTVMTDLKIMFGADEVIYSRINELESQMENDKENKEKRNHIIREIRILISEGYRIHRRIIRNRRSDVWPIQRGTPILDDYYCQHEEQILNILDNWRLDALQNSKEGSTLRSQYEKVYFLFLSAIGSSLSYFKKLIRYRKSRLIETSIFQVLDNEHDKQVLECPSFRDEARLILQFNDVVNDCKGEENQVRLETLSARLSMLKKREREVGLKVVVFVSLTPVIKDVYNYLINYCKKTHLDEFAKEINEFFNEKTISLVHKGMVGEDVEFEVERFKEDATCWILLSDQVGEEGLNLQFAHHVVFYDLPFSPNQIEQRIGRLDRIGQENQIKTYLLIGMPDDELSTPFGHYYSLLKDGLKIFESSVNTIQFIIDSIVPNFMTWLFESGGSLTLSDIGRKISEIQEQVVIEVKKIQNQDLLDEFASDDDGFTNFYEKLELFEGNTEQVVKYFRPWIVEGLQFQFLNGNTGYAWTNHTMVPYDFITTRLQGQVRFEGTYDRHVATRKNKEIFRVGHPFIDTIADYLHWDDRGKVYAIWRYCPMVDMDWQGFKFDILIEVDSSVFDHLSIFERKAITRRGDTFFSPFLVSIFVSLDGTIVDKIELLNYLEKKISKYDANKNPFGYDYNLTRERLSLLKENFSQSLWTSFCTNAYESALSQVIMSKSYIDQVKKAYLKAKKALERREALFQVHQRHSFSQSQSFQRKEKAMGSLLLKAIENAAIKVDSIGFIWLSNQKLQDR